VLLQGTDSLSSPGDSPTRESVVLSLKRDLEEASMHRTVGWRGADCVAMVGRPSHRSV